MNQTIEHATRIAWAWYGKPSTWGGDDPVAGGDCSGFISEILRSFGVIGNKERVTTHTLWQRFAGTDVMIAVGSPREGDIILYSRNGQVSGIEHAAYAISSVSIMEAGGSHPGMDTPQEAAAENAFVRVRPIHYRKHLFAVIRLWP